MAKISKNTYKVKGRKMTTAQKSQRSIQRSSRSSTIAKVTDHSSKGTGKYAKRSSTPLTAKQAFKLEKRSLMNERLGLETKPELIKAAGQALAMNVSPALSSYGASAGISKLVEADNKRNSSGEINQLINGGLDQAGLSNDEELDTLPGGGSIR